MNEKIQNSVPQELSHPVEAGQRDHLDMHTEAGPVLEEDRIGLLLDVIIKNETARKFLGLEFTEDVLEVIRYLKYPEHIPLPAEAAFQHYATAVRLLREKASNTNPILIIPDENHPSRCLLLLFEGRFVRGELVDDKLYRVHTRMASEVEDIDGVEERLRIISRSEYIPELKIERSDGSLSILTEFVPNRREVEKAVDISAFYTFCQEIDFGADTNSTIFVYEEDQLKYVDGDLAEWITNPSQHRFVVDSVTKGATY